MADEDSREKHRGEVNAFLSNQLRLAGNGRVVSMKQTEDVALIIEFENGHRLMFDSYGCGDTYNAQLLVAGSDTYNGRCLEDCGGVDLKPPSE